VLDAVAFPRLAAHSLLNPLQLSNAGLVVVAGAGRRMSVRDHTAFGTLLARDPQSAIDTEEAR
jgi:hypothetical protein